MRQKQSLSLKRLIVQVNVYLPIIVSEKETQNRWPVLRTKEKTHKSTRCIHQQLHFNHLQLARNPSANPAQTYCWVLEGGSGWIIFLKAKREFRTKLSLVIYTTSWHEQCPYLWFCTTLEGNPSFLPQGRVKAV